MTSTLLSRPTVDTDLEFVRIVDELSRRGFLAGAAGAAALLGLAACGDSGSGPAASGSSPAGFPVTVTDTFGTVTISSPPKTVVSAGRTDHDVLLALGVVPVAVYRFVPVMKKGVGPWALSRLGDADPKILTNPLNYELIASLTPDLILDVQSFADKKQYDTLSDIAPTVGLPKGATPNAVPWQQSTEFIATALGRQQDGQKLVAQTNSFLTARAKAHPAFAGKTVSVLLTYGTEVGAYAASDTRMQLLTALGFTPSPFVKGLGDKTFFTQLSPERLADVASDVVVVLSQTGQSQSQQLAAFPTLASIPGYRDGRVLFVSDLNVALAMSSASVLSIPYAVNALEPLLAGATR
jgi:iron complex transport system substrate-binding protein